MRAGISMLFGAVLLVFACCAAAQETAQEVSQAPPQRSEAEKKALFEQVVANQKKSDDALDVYERIERLEIRKNANDAQPYEVKFSRVVPAGTGAARIPLALDGKPADAAAYRARLEKLEHSLAWAAEAGSAQREAYARIEKKRKERNAIIEATRSAFIFTFVAREPRGKRLLTKYLIEPNPVYKPTSRATAIFAKVRGHIWIDEAAGELARVEGEVTDDISIGLFLAKVYKGSHFMQERYEIAPGLWLPAFSQYDFDGRKLFIGFSIHERTLYSNYRRIGPPKEALAVIRAELGESGATAPGPGPGP
jgi:hypothetical protein